MSQPFMGYMLVPGDVMSKADGQVRYVGAHALASLYGVRLRDVRSAPNELGARSAATQGYCLLRPREDGRYYLPAVHEIKCHTVPLTAMREGRKVHEVRLNDRNYGVGDVLYLRGWDGKRYTTGCLWRRVTYLSQGVYGLPPDLCVMSVEPWK